MKQHAMTFRILANGIFQLMSSKTGRILALEHGCSEITQKMKVIREDEMTALAEGQGKFTLAVILHGRSWLPIHLTTDECRVWMEQVQFSKQLL